MRATMRISLGVRRSRTRVPTMSSSGTSATASWGGDQISPTAKRGAHSRPPLSLCGNLGNGERGGGPDIADGSAAAALDQRPAADVAKDDSAKTLLDVAAGALIIFGDDDCAATGP